MLLRAHGVVLTESGRGTLTRAARARSTTCVGYYWWRSLRFGLLCYEIIAIVRFMVFYDDSHMQHVCDVYNGR